MRVHQEYDGKPDVVVKMTWTEARALLQQLDVTRWGNTVEGLQKALRAIIEDGVHERILTDSTGNVVKL